MRTCNPLQLQLRFRTDANIGGVEKLTVSAPRAEFGMVSEFMFDASEIGVECTGLLGAHGIIYAKG